MEKKEKREVVPREETRKRKSMGIKVPCAAGCLFLFEAMQGQVRLGRAWFLFDGGRTEI
jgi:hypothetical protein